MLSYIYEFKRVEPIYSVRILYKCMAYEFKRSERDVEII